jgi:hypothetical protein
LFELTFKITKGGKGMRLKTYLLLVLVLVLAMGMGCSSGSSSGGSSGGGSNNVNVSGTWKGTGNIPETGTLQTTLILNQSGNNVSGTWDTLDATGTVSGNQLTLVLKPYTLDGINYTSGGSAIVDGNKMSGTLYITGTKGDKSVTLNGTFTATRVTSSTTKIADHGPAGGLIGAAIRSFKLKEHNE